MRPMQERAYEKRGEDYVLIKSPPASGKSMALMFIALDKIHNQEINQVIKNNHQAFLHFYIYFRINFCYRPISQILFTLTIWILW